MRRVLIVRTDAIGDAILFNGALPGLRRAFPEARIAIACRESAAPIYQTAPEIDEIFTVDIGAIAKDPAAAAEPAARLSAWGADLLLHPTRSREKHTEGLIARISAARKVALESDLANATAEERAGFDAGYDELIATPDDDACELDRHTDVLKASGIEAVVWPRVLLTEADRRGASDLLTGIAHYAVLSPSARWPIKHYPAWAEAIGQAWSEAPHPPALVAVGGPDAVRPATEIFARLAETLPALRTVDLTDHPDLRTTCAIIAGARLCVGNDTFTAHAAAAFGVASATVVGGGHLGRFLPYDPSSVIATMPLTCDGCHWRCQHRHAHCIRDLPASVVAEAIRLAATPHVGRPRVVVPAETPRFEDGPSGASLPAWLASRVDVVTAASRVPLTVTR